MKCQRCETNEAKILYKGIRFCDVCHAKEKQPQMGAKRLGNFLTNNITNHIGEKLMKS
jgi:hypothetical protein